MSDYVCIVGLDPPEYEEIKSHLDMPVVAHETLPGIVVEDGRLWVENRGRPRFVPVGKVIYHGIFENDLDFISGLALWGGACLPNARAMMDCRLKLPCLVRALDYTQLGSPRGYVAPRMPFSGGDIQRVAKWGNWHCGENKERFTGTWTADYPSIVEPFFEGQAVRVLMIGEHIWQIRLAGDDWLKSIHHDEADFMEIDPDLLDDTRRIRDGFGLEIIANDYIVGHDGSKHLLEVNHIPNVTRFAPVWNAYRDFVLAWLAA